MQALANARTAYEERFGWPAHIETRAERVAVTTGEVLDAIVMPEHLGNAVAHGLVAIMQPAAVLVAGASRQLTILTLPRPATAALPSNLEQARVRLLPHGTPVALPIPGRPHAQVRWLFAPGGPRPSLPDHSVVISLARRAAVALDADARIH